MVRPLNHTKVMEFTSKTSYAAAFERAAEYISENEDLTLISSNTSTFVDGDVFFYQLFLVFDGTDGH